jgi:ornithine decarboxylase
MNDREVGVVRTASDITGAFAPDIPVVVSRPHNVARAARWFVKNFPGKSLYAVKANNDPKILKTLHENGVRSFDVASVDEIAACSAHEGARMYVMHPVKSRKLIDTAYHGFGVRDFALDSEQELYKLLSETGNAADLNLFIRLAVQNTDSAIPLDRKYGAAPQEAVRLLRLARRASEKLGLCFHVGSQNTDPASYRNALRAAWDVYNEAGVALDVVDAGGGFPAAHPGAPPSIIQAQFAEIVSTVAELTGFGDCELLCEPGRALAAEGESLVVRVNGRRGNSLYINDGTYGCLFEGAEIYGALAYPARRINRMTAAPLADFEFWGVSCDSIDYVPGPFALPADICEGDYIEIGLTGAYGRVSASGFNGYGSYLYAEAKDDPFPTMYGESESQDQDQDCEAALA